MPFDFAVASFVTLFVVVDPIGLAPAFLAVTDGLDRHQRMRVALRASVIAATILIGAALAGDWLLRQLGISLSAFRIAGGLLLFSIASEMVFGWRGERETRTAEQAIEEHVRNIAAFPLAIPLLAGPGALTASVLLASQADARPLWLGILIGTIGLVAAASFVSFWLAGRIGRLMGVTGNVVLSRLLGVILAALAVQFVLDGVRAVWAP